MENESLKSATHNRYAYHEPKTRSASYERAAPTKGVVSSDLHDAETQKAYDASSKQLLLNQSHYSPQKSLRSFKSNHSKKRELPAIDAEPAHALGERLLKSETALYQLKVDYARRDTEARESEERIASMT